VHKFKKHPDMQDLQQRLLQMNRSLIEYGDDLKAALQTADVALSDVHIPKRYCPDNVTLDNQQQEIFDLAMQHIENRKDIQSPLTIHVEANAGTGKTFLALVIAAACQQRRDTFLLSAYTAKAASHFPGGHTCHFTFHLNVTDITKRPQTRLLRPGTRQSCASDDLRASIRIRDAALIVVDEISMLRAGELDAIYTSISDIGFIGCPSAPRQCCSISTCHPECIISPDSRTSRDKSSDASPFVVPSSSP
jgi:hypothetical protein